MGYYQLYRTLELPVSLEEAWDFISSPSNLKRITPEHMGFDIISPNLPEKIYSGLIIAYQVSPFLGIKMKWVSEITHVEELSFFVDEQKIGPYRLWHHQHRLESIPAGVVMSDIVTYQPPMGLLGTAANFLVIRKKLNEIFEFRKNRLQEIFRDGPG